MKEVDIVAFARKNGAFFLDGLQYIGDNAQTGDEIIYHELLFEDSFGYILAWSFKVDNHTGKIIPYEGGFKFDISGFYPDEMRKKLAIIDKVKAARESRTE